MPAAPDFLLPRVERAAKRKSHELRRAEAMGFSFEEPNVVRHGDGIVITGSFMCACGRQESYEIVCSEFPHDDIELQCDIGLRLRLGGAFSREHLLNDGFSDREVDEMLARAEAIDDVAPHLATW